ncbi:protein phosphatase 1 regulatory subunit 3E-like [Rhineura floridana]|uniref:protein phosphatase 1 regulatory subunit 3E-like n=1 Tax=Rhineura floridana TaxID=261503 RepID=UPI002AC835AC|nr:protein phosphatase 1 regulatory subunit 3E-like [Rhineura floridana]XP_061450263.1 protein phosphatase 1 regulatory subunit 3E-like [Rhineura floridana]XP_061450264.1 protein phosphatase 1 regulatory subunit 3E-like [Rhineura floridana]XP_061450265.1 protein phosphatase 1 regulatory subunit 3E-like [Rhineura floridana]
MEKAGSLHASVPTPPTRLYLPRNFSCSACLYGSLADQCKGGCSPEPEAVEAPTPSPSSPPPPSPPVTREAAAGAKKPSALPPSRSPSPSPTSPPPPSLSSRGREPTLPPVPPSPTLRRRAKSLPTPGERGLRPALQQSPSRRKTVRFADSLGLELIAVRHFCQADVPRVPAPLAASPFARGAAAADLLKTRKPPALGELEPVLFGPPAPVLEPLFPPQPGSSAGFGERVREQKVKLEWVRPEAVGLRGAVRVLNLAYEKSVSVRYTLNRWASCNEVPATYLPPPPAGHAGDGLTDRFAFHLPVGEGTTLLEFAVRYCVADTEYWDNNDGHNYKLRGRQRPAAAPGQEPDAGGAWIHFI